MSCAVYGCSNSDPATADPSAVYYLFPQNPLLAQPWITACGYQQDEIDTSSARVCSAHFDPGSYTPEVKVTGLDDSISCCIKLLKPDAVPTLFLPEAILIKNVSSDDELAFVFSDASADEECIELRGGSPGGASESGARADVSKYQHVKTVEQLRELQKRNRKLREAVEVKEGNSRILRATLDRQMQDYREKKLEMARLQQECREKELEEARLQQDFARRSHRFLSVREQKELLGKVFSDSQVKILSGRKKVGWSDDDMAVGYTLRHLTSRRCYSYLSKKMKIPLPSIHSIERWVLRSLMTKGKVTSGGGNKDESSNIIDN